MSDEHELMPRQEPFPETPAEVFVEQGQVAEFRVALPKGMSVDREAMERCLSAIGLASRPVSFELIGLPGSTIVQFACAAHDRNRVERQLQAFFPEASL